MEKILRAIINVAAELRNLSFAVTTPPMPDWFTPPAEGVDGRKSTSFEYEYQRLSQWPSYWIQMQREVASKNIRYTSLLGEQPESTPTPSDGSPTYRGG